MISGPAGLCWRGQRDVIRVHDGPISEALTRAAHLHQRTIALGDGGVKMRVPRRETTPMKKTRRNFTVVAATFVAVK